MSTTSNSIPTTSKANDTFVALVLLGLIILTGCQAQTAIQSYGNTQDKQASAQFSIPEEFNLLFVNGKKHPQPLISSDTRIQLAAGKYNFVVEYDTFWINELGDDDRIRSQPILLGFTAEPGKSYQLDFTAPADINQAAQYAKRPLVKVREIPGSVIDASIKYQLEDAMLNSRFRELTALPPDSPPNPLKAKAETETMPANGKAMEMLQYWWQEANDSQKRAFKQWLEQQP